jgi:CTP:molybdopterin cytidylyltransferase MocA
MAAILLAAGGGRRFASSLGAATDPYPSSAHKLLAPLDGRPVYRHALDHVLAAAIGTVVVVTGAVPLDLPATVTEVHHAAWADGQAGSLHAGLSVARALNAEFVVIGLADQPGIPADAWRLIAGAPTGWQIVVASYDGTRGPNPVRLHRSVWDLVPATGDQGARTLIAGRPALVHEVACPGSAHDIDTLEDLQAWKSS